MMRFKVGDQVIVRAHHPYATLLVGSVGTVISLLESLYFVRCSGLPLPYYPLFEYELDPMPEEEKS